MHDFVKPDFVRPDFERAKRKGVPEVILADGKTVEHALQIVQLFLERNGRAILTRVSPELEARLRREFVREDGVHVSVAAAELCAEKGVRLVGIDYFTVDAYADKSFAVHRALLGAEVLILETINLRGVPPGRYTLICLPLRLSGAEASPVRAVLLR